MSERQSAKRQTTERARSRKSSSSDSSESKPTYAPPQNDPLQPNDGMYADPQFIPSNQEYPQQQFQDPQCYPQDPQYYPQDPQYYANGPQFYPQPVMMQQPQPVILQQPQPQPAQPTTNVTVNINKPEPVVLIPREPTSPFTMTLIFFILGFFVCCFWIVAFIYSRKSKEKGTRMLGIVSIILTLLMVGLYIAVVVISLVGGKV